MEPIFPTRRRLLLGTTVAGLLLSPLGRGIAQIATERRSSMLDLIKPTQRYALLIGNRNYVTGSHIPPAYKNIADLSNALDCLEFGGSAGRLSSYRDLGPGDMRLAISKFGKESAAIAAKSHPESMVFLFYFCGHGTQYEGENYLVPAGINPLSPDARNQSIPLSEVLAALPSHRRGLSMVIIDACRSGETPKGLGESLAQVSTPPEGIMLMLSATGRPALAPSDINRNTPMARSIIDQLSNGDSVNPVKFKFQDALISCQELARIELNVTQTPDFTSNVLGNFSLDPIGPPTQQCEVITTSRMKTPPSGEPSKSIDPPISMLISLENILSPRKMQRLCSDLLTQYPRTRYANMLGNLRRNAQDLAEVLRKLVISVDTLSEPYGDQVFRQRLQLALQSRDRDAAYLIAQAYHDGTNGVTRDDHRWEVWMKLAAHLGNGKAAYELSEYYKTLSSAGYTVEIAELIGIMRDLNFIPPQQSIKARY